MADNAQNSPIEPDPPQTGGDTSNTARKPNHAPEHSAGGADFQAFKTRLARRTEAIDELLSEKEQLQLGYVFRDVPIPFYERWKKEGNEVFALRVRMKMRKASLANAKKG